MATTIRNSILPPYPENIHFQSPKEKGFGTRTSILAIPDSYEALAKTISLKHLEKPDLDFDNEKIDTGDKIVYPAGSIVGHGQNLEGILLEDWVADKGNEQNTSNTLPVLYKGVVEVTKLPKKIAEKANILLAMFPQIKFVINYR